MRQVLKTWVLAVGFLCFFVEPALAFDHQHSEWDAIVKRSVTWAGDSSFVDYKALKAEPKELDRYLKYVSEVKSSEFTLWTRNQQLAFLINAYNAWTVRLILDNYPVRSIKDIGGLFSNPWKKEFFELFENDASLDWIEHKKIRPQYNEPRIHFALVCASKGCPGLRSEAFIAEKLEAQLEDSTFRFLKDSSRNRYALKNNELFLSSIFKWYKDDFVKAKGSVQEFVLPYMTSDANRPKSNFSNVPIHYLDYDWTLNEK